MVLNEKTRSSVATWGVDGKLDLKRRGIYASDVDGSGQDVVRGLEKIADDVGRVY